MRKKWLEKRGYFENNQKQKLAYKETSSSFSKYTTSRTPKLLVIFLSFILNLGEACGCTFQVTVTEIICSCDLYVTSVAVFKLPQSPRQSASQFASILKKKKKSCSDNWHMTSDFGDAVAWSRIHQHYCLERGKAGHLKRLKDHFARRHFFFLSSFRA